MTIMMNKLRPAAALAVVAAIGAGCGSDASSSGAGTDTAAVGTTHTTKLSARDKAVKFSACVRSHGVKDFPDPDANNDYNYGVSVSEEVWTSAVNACKALQPPGTLSAKRTATQQSASLRFAQCVRDHGVKDFPDPVNGEPVINTYKIPSSNRPGGMAILNAAVGKCRTSLQEVLGGKR
jgi:hypothetical protein